MITLLVTILAVFILAVFFPQETLTWIRQLRRGLRDDARRRVTPEQWEAIQHEFDDVGL